MKDRSFGTFSRCPRLDEPRHDVPIYGKRRPTGTPKALHPQPEVYTVLIRQAHNAPQVVPGRRPNTANLVPNLEIVTKLLHFAPALLHSSGGHCSRKGCYTLLSRRDPVGLIDRLILFVGRRRQKPLEDLLEIRRWRASRPVYKREAMTKDASAPMSPPAAPRDNKTLATLCIRHTTGYYKAIAIGLAQAVKCAGTNAMSEKANK